MQPKKIMQPNRNDAPMTEAQQRQYDRFMAAGYSPEDATRLIALGVWLGAQDRLPETVADINRYRAGRDARAAQEGAGGNP